ncbi:MAG: hypothetical protein AB1631_17615 [Acidobacteriota bacterium]
MSLLQKYLFTPHAPNTAAGFTDDSFSVVDVRRSRGAFSLSSSAVTQLPHGILTAAFDEPNIQNRDEMIDIIASTVEAAGLGNKKRWSIALPEGAARSLIVALESRPASRKELTEVLSWKIERVIAAPASQLRVSRQRLSREGGQERYLVTVAREEVISEYEAIFESLGWQAGLIAPRHLGEAQWLVWADPDGESMMISANYSGFSAVVVRGGEPVMVRASACEPEARIDELHRFALYYRDRAEESRGVEMRCLLVLGDIDQAEAQSAVADALGVRPRLISAMEFGFDLVGQPIKFEQLASAAGLATMAWQ